MTQQEVKTLIDTLLKSSQKVPTQFHLQPALFFVATEEDEKAKLVTACLNLPAAEGADAIIVFTGDRNADKNHLEAVLDLQLEHNLMTIPQAESVERAVKMNFDTTPMGFGWIGKLFALPLLKLFTPMPRLACIYKREWLIKQVMRNVVLFWCKAKEKGVHAEFIDMYDERRVKSALSIPWHHVVVQVMAIRLKKEYDVGFTPLPIEELVQWNTYD